MNKKSLIFDISKFYSFAFEASVYLSSLFFLSVFLTIIIMVLDILGKIISPSWIMLMLMFLMTFLLKVKAITLLASGFILLLFLNLYLTVSDFLKEISLTIFEFLEGLINQFVFGFVIKIVFFLVFTYFLSFIFNKAKKRTSKFLDSLFILILIFLTGFVLAFPSEIIINNLYPKIGWVLGGSLIFLHFNYLLKEIGKFLKRRNLKIID